MANENTNNQNVINDSSEIAVRRGKLATLRENGMDIVIATTAKTDDEARALLTKIGLPLVLK